MLPKLDPSLAHTLYVWGYVFSFGFLIFVNAYNHWLNKHRKPAAVEK